MKELLIENFGDVLTNLVTILIAVVSAVFTGIMSYRAKKAAEKSEKEARKYNEKILRLEQREENARNKNQIDAQVVWTARVEWIQNVRKLSIDFLSAINSYIETGDRKRQYEELIWEKSRLLILYFGPDEENGTACDLMNKETNNGKNEKIVELIKTIADGAPAYMMKKQWILNEHNTVEHCRQCKESDDIYESCEIIVGVPNEDIEDECRRHLNEALLNEQRYLRENEEFKKNITEFAEAMRIYLKIEWNRTKKRDYI